MGASLSNLSENGSGNGRPGLGDIPESCVACVFLYLTPPEICNLARLNRAFRGAASSDAVWEAKLPSNYHHLLNLLSHPDVYENLSRKDIFALLSRPLPFEDDNKARFQYTCGFLVFFFYEYQYNFILYIFAALECNQSITFYAAIGSTRIVCATCFRPVIRAAFSFCH